MKYCTTRVVLALLAWAVVHAQDATQYNGVKRIFKKCKPTSPKFDTCLKNAFNNLRPFFKAGIPEMGVAPFDPHFAVEVNQKRGGPNFNYHLRLNNVYEYGWTISEVTKLRTDLKNNRIIYTQYFPEKSLKGDYTLTARGFGGDLKRKGVWNLTLYDYAQTTTITRKPTYVGGVKTYNGQPLDVHVEIDRIGNMDIHASNILNGAGILERILDLIVNSSWRIGYPMIRPLINDLVSTAFTKIWTDSFRYFPLDDIFGK